MPDETHQPADGPVRVSLCIAQPALRFGPADSAGDGTGARVPRRGPDAPRRARPLQ